MTTGDSVTTKQIDTLSIFCHLEFSGGITILTVCMEVANFCVAMDTLIDQDDILQRLCIIFFMCNVCSRPFHGNSHFILNHSKFRILGLL